MSYQDIRAPDATKGASQVKNPGIQTYTLPSAHHPPLFFLLMLAPIGVTK